jgi:ABC-2 type transport system permease protein
VPVYDRRYRGFAGERRSGAGNWLVLTRYGLGEVFASRLLLVLFVAACLPFVVCALVVYAANNADSLAALNVRDSEPLLATLEGSLFFWFLVLQSGFAFLIASFTGPALIGPDLAHGSLPLYLSRPLSRFEFAAGKLAILLLLLSAVTWVPGLLLVAIEAAMGRDGWLAAHWRIPFAIFVGSGVWIVMLALLALAISAWIRWRPLATGALFVLSAVGSAFAGVLNATLETRWGSVLSIGEVVKRIWTSLFGEASFLGRAPVAEQLPVGACWLAVGAFSGVAALLLRRKIRAFEVVR